MPENTEELPESDAQGGIDLNEDLFDFPSDGDFTQAPDVVPTTSVGGSAPASVSQSEVKPSGEPSGEPTAEDEDIFDFQGHDEIMSSDESLGDLSLGTRHLEDLIEAADAVEGDEETPAAPEEAAAQPAPAARPAPKATKPAISIPQIPQVLGTTELDEDLFQFDNPDEPDTSATLQHSDLVDRQGADEAPTEEPSGAPSAEASTAAPATTGAAQEADATAAKPAPAAAQAEPQVEAGSASAAPATSAPASPSTATPDLSQPVSPSSAAARQTASEALAATQAARRAMLEQHPGMLVPVSDTGWNRRMVIGIAVAFLVVNASLILITGRLTDSVNTALDEVRQDLSRSLEGAQQSAPPVQVVIPPELLPKPEPEPTAQAEAPEPAPKTTPTVLMDVASREVALAHEEIEAGECAAARRRLYRLLANRDRLIISADILAEAEFLVAESYFAEAKKVDTLTEGGKP